MSHIHFSKWKTMDLVHHCGSRSASHVSLSCMERRLCLQHLATSHPRRGLLPEKLSSWKQKSQPKQRARNETPLLLPTSKNPSAVQKADVGGHETGKGTYGLPLFNPFLYCVHLCKALKKKKKHGDVQPLLALVWGIWVSRT